MSKINMDIMNEIYNRMDAVVEELIAEQRSAGVRDFNKYQYNSGRVNGAIKMLNIFSASLNEMLEAEREAKISDSQEVIKKWQSQL